MTHPALYYDLKALHHNTRISKCRVVLYACLSREERRSHSDHRCCDAIERPCTISRSRESIVRIEILVCGLVVFE